VILIEISTLQGNNRYSNFIYTTIKKLKKIYTDRITINLKNQPVGEKLLFNICNGSQLHSLNYSMEQSPSGEANQFSVCQEIP